MLPGTAGAKRSSRGSIEPSPSSCDEEFSCSMLIERGKEEDQHGVKTGPIGGGGEGRERGGG